MKNIRFNKNSYISRFKDEIIDSVVENGRTIIFEKPIKEIFPACGFFDFIPEVGDVFLIKVTNFLPFFYITDSPKGWPGEYSSLKLDAGIYHIKITHIYNDVLFYKIIEKKNSYENTLDLKFGWPSNFYFDIKDLPKDDKIKYLDINKSF